MRKCVHLKINKEEIIYRGSKCAEQKVVKLPYTWVSAKCLDALCGSDCFICHSYSLRNHNPS